MIKISIITAVYNRSETILSAIQSVKHQNYSNIEYIIVDGASTDGTTEIIRSNIDPGDIFICEPDFGIYDALNKGINQSTGDVIAFLHSDDFYSNSNVISEVAKAFKDTNIDAVYGDIAFLNNKNKIIRVYCSGEFSLRRLSWGWMPAHPALFLRKSLYKKYGNFKTDYKIAADYEILCRIMSLGNINSTYFPKVFINMRTGGVSTSGIINTIFLNLEVLRACRENSINTNLIKILSKYPKKLMERIFN